MSRDREKPGVIQPGSKVTAAAFNRLVRRVDELERKLAEQKPAG
jgi:hypothetical protein